GRRLHLRRRVGVLRRRRVDVSQERPRLQLDSDLAGVIVRGRSTAVPGAVVAQRLPGDLRQHRHLFGLDRLDEPTTRYSWVSVLRPGVGQPGLSTTGQADRTEGRSVDGLPADA